jgi:hypothetical protein
MELWDKAEHIPRHGPRVADAGMAHRPWWEYRASLHSQAARLLTPPTSLNIHAQETQPGDISKQANKALQACPRQVRSLCCLWEHLLSVGNFWARAHTSPQSQTKEPGNCHLRPGAASPSSLAKWKERHLKLGYLRSDSASVTGWPSVFEHVPYSLDTSVSSTVKWN